MNKEGKENNNKRTRGNKLNQKLTSPTYTGTVLSFQMYKLPSDLCLPVSPHSLSLSWLRSHCSLLLNRSCDVHTCGQPGFFPSLLQLSTLRQMASLSSRNFWAVNIASRLHISSFSRIFSPPLSVIFLPTSSYSLINSLIKDTTSKSTLRGLCLTLFAEMKTKGGNRAGATFLRLSFLLPTSSSTLAVIISCGCRRSPPSFERSQKIDMAKVNWAIALPES